MRAPGGWQPPPADQYQGGHFQFINCGIAGKRPPVAYLKYAGMGDIGQEYTLIDAQTQNSFGGVVRGGGSNHYKVRYDGTNWIRVG